MSSYVILPFACLLLRRFMNINKQGQLSDSVHQMIRTSPFFLSFAYTNIKQSLKLLDVKVPTSKAAIKKQYLALAKKYHPDSNEQISGIKDKAKRQQVYKLFEQKFIEISKAYQYLKDLKEEQINLMREKNSSGRTTGTEQADEQKQKRKAKMTTEEMTRQQAYEYFNSTYRRQNMEQGQINHPQQNQLPRKRQPLMKVIPEIFVGFLLLAMILGDWTYKVYKRKQTEGPAPQQSPSRLQYNDAFKGLNMSQRFGKEQKNRKQIPE